MIDFDENYDEIYEKVESLLKEKKYNDLRTELLALYPNDIALLFEDMPDEYMPVMFRLLPKETAADVFVELETDSQEMLIKGFSDKELSSILDEMYMDDTVDIIEEMPAQVVKRILKYCDADSRKDINKLLQYPEDSAGSLMTTEFIRLRRNNSVSDAFDIIRQKGDDAETINVCYVTDESRHLLGYVTIRTLVLAKDTSAKINEIMDPQIISVGTHEDKETVVQEMSKYDFDSMPVVDSENRIVGIITFDDAIDVMEEEATEDIAKMAAITNVSDTTYLKTKVTDIWKTRIPWLAVLMLSSTFTGMIITGYEDALAAYVALTAFIPMLMGTGGNSGSQASVTVIRSLSLNELDFGDLANVAWKEFRVSILCGLSLAIISFFKVWLFDGLILGNNEITASVSFVVSLALLVTVIIAKIVGSIIPIIAKKLGADPAVMSSPFLTTIVDALSLLIYFSIAKLILHI